MGRSAHAQGVALLEEGIAVLFCLVDDAYTNLNPNARLGRASSFLVAPEVAEAAKLSGAT